MSVEGRKSQFQTEGNRAIGDATLSSSRQKKELISVQKEKEKVGDTPPGKDELLFSDRGKGEDKRETPSKGGLFQEKGKKRM